MAKPPETPKDHPESQGAAGKQPETTGTAMSGVGSATGSAPAGPTDGVVAGTPGDDLIDVDYAGDPEGDVVDAPLGSGTDPLDDSILAGDGNDTVEARLGDDTVHGGAGDDRLDGAVGDDLLFGEAGADTLEGGVGNDTLSGGGEGDLVFGGAGRDSIAGNSGDDTLISGAFGLPDLGFSGVFPADGDPDNDRDRVEGGMGHDVIITGDDADTIRGGQGEDTIFAGLDADQVRGGAGDDFIDGGEGADTIRGGTGNDTIYAGFDNPAAPPGFPAIADDGATGGPDPAPGNDRDVVFGGSGDDEIYGGDDGDRLQGGRGADVLDGGLDDDTLRGGTGADTLIGGHGADLLLGENDADLFRVARTDAGDPAEFAAGSFIGDTVDGGAGGTDDDTLDLRGSAPAGGRFSVTITSPDSNGNGSDGYVEFFDAGDALAGRLEFTEIENIIVCFTAGTLIATPRGEIAVEDLRPGDKVITRDNGLQEIAWTGARSLSPAELRAAPEMRPIRIAAGALGSGLPERDITVSPQHRLLIANDRTELFFEEREVLAAAKHLVEAEGVTRLGTETTRYIHFMCARHEVVLSNGAWTESFQPGDFSLGTMGEGARREILTLFPELASEDGLRAYPSARTGLKRHEARLLTQR